MELRCRRRGFRKSALNVDGMQMKLRRRKRKSWSPFRKTNRIIIKRGAAGENSENPFQILMNTDKIEHHPGQALDILRDSLPNPGQALDILRFSRKSS